MTGGGIVGCSTAYFLKKRGAQVAILEACEIAAGASGKAGGLLAEDWHGPATESLSALSYRLHREFAAKFGAESIGYRPMTTLSVSLDVGAKRGKNVPDVPWINPEAVVKSAMLGDTRTTAQVHPRLLTQRLAKEVGNTIIGQAHSLEYTEDKLTAVLAKDKSGQDMRIACTDVVLAAGPWTSKLLRKVFANDSSINVKDYSITSSRAHSIVVRSSEPLSAHALFTNIKTGRKTAEPELYARPDGTGYLCGPTDHLPLPERADQVSVDDEAIKRLIAEAILISPSALGQKAVVEAKQACYLPYSESTGSPILARAKSNVYFAAGHSCWGILQGPATGMAMSELILDGKVTCCDVSMLTT